MKDICVVYLTCRGKEAIMSLPSNVSYYIKNMYGISGFSIKILNPAEHKNILSLFFAIRKCFPDILYIDNLQGLNMLVVLKRLHLLNCKIVVWKYTQCAYHSHSLVGNLKNLLLKHFYWKGFDRIYMAYDKHTLHAVSNRIVPSSKIITLSRGVDVGWYQRFMSDKTNTEDFLVVATGKDNRDYLTLCKACEEAGTPCLILTRRHPANVRVSMQFSESKYIKMVFVEDLQLEDEYGYIMQQVAKASVLAIPCEDVPYGVGYTNEIEALPYHIPILVTRNKYAHLLVEKEGIGYEIGLHDVSMWKDRILYLKSHPEVISEMRQNVKSLIDREYNDTLTGQFIMKDFMELCI